MITYIHKKLLLYTANKIASELGHTSISHAHLRLAILSFTDIEKFEQAKEKIIHTIGKGYPYNTNYCFYDEITEKSYNAYPQYIKIIK